MGNAREGKTSHNTCPGRAQPSSSGRRWPPTGTSSSRPGAGRFGHYEMDTVVSGTNGREGLLVLIDRKSRRYVAELIEQEKSFTRWRCSICS